MMRNLVCVTVVLFLIAIASPAMAQVEERDLMEISLFGGLGVPSSGLTDWQTAGEDRAAETGFDVGMDIGFMITSKFVSGINFTYTQYSFDDTLEQSNHSHRLYNPNLYVKYLFEGESYFVPYVKGHIGMYFPKFSTFVRNDAGDRFRELSYDPALGFGVGAGLFYYTADFSGLYLEGNYHYAFTEDVKGSYQGRDYRFGENLSSVDIHFGIRVLFGTGG